MQMHWIRLILLENDLIEQSCLMYLAKQVPFVNRNMRLSVKEIQVGAVFFQVTKLQLLFFFLMVIAPSIANKCIPPVILQLSCGDTL